MYWVQDILTSTRLVSAKFWIELNNTAKPTLGKARFKHKPVLWPIYHIPRMDANRTGRILKETVPSRSNRFDWSQVDRLFLLNISVLIVARSAIYLIFRLIKNNDILKGYLLFLSDLGNHCLTKAFYVLDLWVQQYSTHTRWRCGYHVVDHMFLKRG